MRHRMLGAWLAMCAVAPPSAASAQAGVLVRGLSATARCSPGGEHTHIGQLCPEITCDSGRACVELAGVGARCIDPNTEIVCVAGDRGCDDCPLNHTTGADPEACRVVELAKGSHSLCIYSPRLVCLAEAAFAFEALLCLPVTEDEPSTAGGDCDGDGVANAEDSCLCELGTGPSCGLPAPDAGSSRDAGARADAAPMVPDASRPGDGSVAPVFRGGGGCACGVHRGPASSAPGTLAVVLLALRRRR